MPDQKRPIVAVDPYIRQMILDSLQSTGVYGRPLGGSPLTMVPSYRQETQSPQDILQGQAFTEIPDVAIPWPFTSMNDYQADMERARGMRHEQKRSGDYRKPRP